MEARDPILRQAVRRFRSLDFWAAAIRAIRGLIADSRLTFEMINSLTAPRAEARELIARRAGT